MARFSEATLVAGVERAITDAVRELQETEIKRAVNEFERKLREKIAVGAMNIHSLYRVERHAMDLVIRVQIGEDT